MRGRTGGGVRGGLAGERRKAPVRALSWLVLAVLAATGAGGALLARSALRAEQARLLQERAREAAAVLETLLGSVASSLSSLAADSPTPADAAAFARAASSDLGGLSTIGAAQPGPAGFQVFAGVGAHPDPGAVLGAERAALADRALGTRGVVAGFVDTSGGLRMSLAASAPGEVVVYGDLAFDPARTYHLGAGGPFAELDGALYAGRSADPALLVIKTTPSLPLRGLVASTPVTVAGQSWLLVVRSRVPLVGALAAKAPWAVLAGGLLAAVFATVLVEALGRRRAYALALVERRTAELRQAREAAEAANRAKSEFLSRVSHELRTPLNAILGFGQLLELDDLAPPQAEAVDQILKGGRHLLGLINEVLDISRIESGTLALSPEPVSVSEAVGEVVSLMAPLAAQRQVRILVRPPADGAARYVRADRQRLTQILLNLVSNAVKYNRPGGTVTISSPTGDGGGATVVVADTGAGIPAEDLGRLFTPFDRLGAEGGEVEGTGVGLALSESLAAAMGGSISVSSVVGEGTSFSLHLPRAEGTPRARPGPRRRPLRSPQPPLRSPRLGRSRGLRRGRGREVAPPASASRTA